MPEKPLSVSALTDYIKYKFDNDKNLRNIHLEGEISNFKRHRRGHFYFTLKDSAASISAVMFRGRTHRVPFTPEDGMNVIVQGSVSVFKVAGSYQVYVDDMLEVGLGNLYRQYLELKATLEKEGYFDKARKRALPEFPSQIAVLTSSTGAAVRDIIQIISRRYPLVKVLVYPTTVQGERAKEEIKANIELADADPENDVLIVGRGGGSIEDLWAFNERMVADAIYHAQTPVVSAVGHETDFTIADFVADMRAPTPSGAAELVVPDQKSLRRDIERMRGRVADRLSDILDEKRKRLSDLGSRYVLKDPPRILEPMERRLEYLQDKLRILHPKKKLSEQRRLLEDHALRLSRAFRQRLTEKRHRLETKGEQLKYLDPRRLMERGYTLAKKRGEIVKRVKDLRTGDKVELEFYDGSVSAEVKDKKEKKHEG